MKYLNVKWLLRYQCCFTRGNSFKLLNHTFQHECGTEPMCDRSCTTCCLLSLCAYIADIVCCRVSMMSCDCCLCVHILQILYAASIYDVLWLLSLCTQMSSRPLSVTSRRKRAQPAVSGGIPGSYDDKDSNFAW